MVKRSRIWIFLKVHGLPEMVGFSVIFTVVMCSLIALMFGIDSKFKKPVMWKYIFMLALGLILIFSAFIMLFYGKYILDILIKKIVWTEEDVIKKSDIREYIIRTIRTRKIGEKILIRNSQGKEITISLLDKVAEEINKNPLSKKKSGYRKRYYYLYFSKLVIDIEFIRDK